VRSCEHGNSQPDSIKCGEFSPIDRLSINQEGLLYAVRHTQYLYVNENIKEE